MNQKGIMFNHIEFIKSLLAAWRTSEAPEVTISSMIYAIPPNQVGATVLLLKEKAEAADRLFEKYRHPSHLSPPFFNSPPPLSSTLNVPYCSSQYGLPRGIPFDSDQDAPQGVLAPISDHLPENKNDLTGRIDVYLDFINTAIKLKAKIKCMTSLPGASSSGASSTPSTNASSSTPSDPNDPTPGILPQTPLDLITHRQDQIPSDTSVDPCAGLLSALRKPEVCAKKSPTVSIPSLPTPSSLFSTISTSSLQKTLRSVWRLRHLVEHASASQPAWRILEAEHLEIADIEDMLIVVESMLGAQGEPGESLDYPSKNPSLRGSFKSQQEQYTKDLAFALTRLHIPSRSPAPALSEPAGRPEETSYVYDAAWLRSLLILEATKASLRQLKPCHSSVDLQVKYRGQSHSMLACKAEIDSLLQAMYDTIASRHDYKE